MTSNIVPQSNEFVSAKKLTNSTLNGNHSPLSPPEINDLLDASEIRSPEKQFHFNPLSLADLMKLPPKEWIIEQVIGRGDLGMIYGPPGSAKTFTVIDLVLSACMGKKWATRFDITEPLSVAYCAGEGVSGLAGRYQAAAEYYAAGELENFTFFAEVPQLFLDASNHQAIDTILTFVNEWQVRQETGDAAPLDILVIDTYHSATAGTDENSAQHAGSVVRMLRKATKALGCAVILVHHSNKAGTGERGSSALRGAMDCMIECKQIGNRFGIACEKLKDDAQWLPQQFDLIVKGESARIDWDAPKAPENSTGAKANKIIELLKAEPETKLTAKQIAEAIGSTASPTSNMLSRLVEKGKVTRQLYEVEAPPSNKNPWVYFVDTSNPNPLNN